jgi:hypothetical protein
MPSYDDLDRARSQLAALKELFARHSGEADARALRWLTPLCRDAAIDDEYCRDKLAKVEELGAEMFSYGGARRFGTDFLRQQVLNALELLESRLYSIGLLRRSYGRRALSISGVEIHPV